VDGGDPLFVVPQGADPGCTSPVWDGGMDSFNDLGESENRAKEWVPGFSLRPRVHLVSVLLVLEGDRYEERTRGEGWVAMSDTYSSIVAENQVPQHEGFCPTGDGVLTISHGRVAKKNPAMIRSTA
jgi:hypothetical protein